MMLVVAFALAFGCATAARAAAPVSPINVAFFGVEFLNDNEGSEPTTAAEKGRIQNIERILTSRLQQSGQYNFIPVSVEVRNTIAKGQSLGHAAAARST